MFSVAWNILRYKGGVSIFSYMLLFLVFSLGIPFLIINRIVKSVKVDNDLQRKKKEKEIELLQAQIDSLKGEKGT